MKAKQAVLNWLRNDELYMKIKDMSGKVIYKSRINISSKKELANAFTVLEKYGIDMKELAQIIEQRKEVTNFWFG